jgi:UDP-N-acetylmuramyl pentapeptide synthase
MLKKILQFVLARKARAVLHRYNPQIIAITGSVGKTGTKEAIAKVLADRFELRESYKNYNNEIGLPLTVLGTVSAGRSLSGWLRILRSKNEFKSYPEALVLEMGIDRPGDMDYLVAIARPTRAVITKLGQAHLEFFSSLEELHKEKIKLALAVGEDGFVIYNYDDERLRQVMQNLKCRTISFGFDPKADVRAENMKLSFGSGEEVGVSFKLFFNGSAIPVFLSNAIGRPPVYAALAAAAVALSYDLNGLEVSQNLRAVEQPAGRLKLLSAKGNALIVDDSYNSSLDSVLEGLNACLEIKKEFRKRFFAVLGDMRELGQMSDESHREVGRVSAKVADYVIAVGEKSKLIAEAAKKELSEVYWFANAKEAADFLEIHLKSGDLFYIKGSQAVRLEKIVKRLMADPSQAEHLLVRQGSEWKDK